MKERFRLMELARMVNDDVIDFLDSMQGRALHDKQLRDSVQSISANIREAYGRERALERRQFFRFARGSSEETDEHLRPNFRQKLLDKDRYWRLHNRLAVIVKMLTTLMGKPLRR